MQDNFKKFYTEIRSIDNQVNQHFKHGSLPKINLKSREHLKTVNTQLDVHFYTKRLLSKDPTGKHRSGLLTETNMKFLWN